MFLGDKRVEDKKGRWADMVEVSMRNWDVGEFRVRDNMTISMKSDKSPDPVGKTPIQGILNHIRQAIPHMFHIHSDLPYRSNLYPPSLCLIHMPIIMAEYNDTLSLSISPCHDQELIPSMACTEYSICRVQRTPSAPYSMYRLYWVQHSPSTAYTKYTTHWVQHTPCTAYTEYSIHWV